ncbi:hypothetical protein OI70_18865 [Dickeya fangzhongdai]|uniref:STY4528 family pathogenicity island replication protein n=1 Tax=Dickeya fangzhongdai TaxID=1778540 RepID=UPI000574156C|nr:STY4528 family pathogenicity island replication protein [Dickeya fangzhongdai]KHN52869.1 hypothetical protein OI70_18865 [Dickeya fangzhongdai]
MTAQRRTGRPAQLGELFDNAFARLRTPPHITSTPAESEASSPLADSFIFSGNRHDSVPRALLQDKRLTPLERNAWQILHLMLTTDSITTMPTYDQLAPWLASMPCAARASHETVARTLSMLRLTRWLSLVRRRRDAKTGRILSNLYVLHDDPLTPYEAIQLDRDYLELICQSLTHTSKSIQRVGVHTLHELTQDPLMNRQVLPTRLQILSQRFSAQNWCKADQSTPVNNPHCKESTIDFLRNQANHASEYEPRTQPLETGTVRNPKADRIVRINKTIRTIPHVQAELRLPERFQRLKPEQQSGALAALQSVEHELRQPLLDEWDARCASNAIRNPTGYLFGIIQKALRGKFHAWAARKAPEPPEHKTSKPSPTPIQPADAEVALAHLARLRGMLRS